MKNQPDITNILTNKNHMFSDFVYEGDADEGTERVVAQRRVYKNDGQIYITLYIESLDDETLIATMSDDFYNDYVKLN